MSALKDGIGKYIAEAVAPHLGVKGITIDKSGFIAQSLDSTLGEYAEWSQMEGYRKNAAVFACISALAFGFPRIRYRISDRQKTLLPDHDAQRVLDRPNDEMSQAELLTYTIVYLAGGGNCYWHKLRNGYNKMVGLKPYSISEMVPEPSRVPGPRISHYRARQQDGTWKIIPREDVIHLKWPAIDPERPYMALSPLRVMGYEVGADSEATRYQYALIKNDAIPRGVLAYAKDAEYVSDDAEIARKTWKQRFSEGGRGDIAVLPPAISYQRVSLNLEELAFDALRRVPETRIASGFRVPAIIAGLLAGLERGTYANFKEARQMFTEETLLPLWDIVGDEIEQEFRREFDDAISVKADISTVPALQENEDARFKRAIDAYREGVIDKNEAREMIGRDARDGGDTFKETAKPMKIQTVPDDEA